MSGCEQRYLLDRFPPAPLVKLSGIPIVLLCASSPAFLSSMRSEG